MTLKYLKRELIGTLNTVIFCPEDFKLIKGLRRVVDVSSIWKSLRLAPPIIIS